jgi:hypothetical protein
MNGPEHKALYQGQWSMHENVSHTQTYSEQRQFNVGDFYAQFNPTKRNDIFTNDNNLERNAIVVATYNSQRTLVNLGGNFLKFPLNLTYAFNKYQI